MDSKALDAINEFLTSFKDSWCGPVRGRSNPSYIAEGLFAIKKELLPEFSKACSEAKKTLAGKLSDDLRQDWDAAISRAELTPVNKGGLGPLFVRSAYPPVETVLGKFGIDWNVLELKVPDDVPEEIKAQKLAEWNLKLDNAYETMIGGLYDGFSAIVDHAIEKLTTVPGEKPKRIHETLVTNFLEFIGTFKDRNMGAPDLEPLVAKAQEIISPDGKPIDIERLRKFANVREDLREKLSGVKSALDGMIVDRRSRKIDLTED